MKKILLFLLLAFVSQVAVIGQSMLFTRYTEEEGLPSPLVKSITTGHNGIVWAATDEGLVRFDGRDFRLFSDELPEFMPSQCLRCPMAEYCYHRYGCGTRHRQGWFGSVRNHCPWVS
ncbi:MAG: hypothetical protein IPF68_11580 [Bacteroidales bacterium]|nr:hypothetical protein [Bacteroidales bacterium]